MSKNQDIMISNKCFKSIVDIFSEIIHWLTKETIRDVGVIQYIPEMFYLLCGILVVVEHR